MKKIVVLFGFLLSMNAFAHLSGENITPLGDDQTEKRMQEVRDGAKSFCEDLDDDQRELCVMDFYTQHDLEEEPSCD